MEGGSSSGDGDVSQAWKNLDDLSMSILQQSMTDTTLASNLSGIGLQDYGLEDLSCSLINCKDNENGEALSTLLSACTKAETFDVELSKRDKVIRDLCNTLGEFVKQREEGDSVLGQLEDKVHSLYKDVTNKESSSLSILNDGSGGGDVEMCSKNETDAKEPLSCTVKKLSEPVALKKYSDTTRRVLELKDVSVQCNVPDYTSTPQPLINPKPRILSTEKSKKVENDRERDELLNESFGSEDYDLNVQKFPTYQPINVETLRLTFSPSICEYEADTGECNGNEHVSAITEDLRLRLNDTERKLESTKKYLEEMTFEREQEREDFQRTINELVVRCEDIRKDKEKLESLAYQQKMELDDLAEHFQECSVIKDELLKRTQTSEEELSRAVEKVCELRDIIRALEDQIEEATRQASTHAGKKRGIPEEPVVDDVSRGSCEECRPNDDVSVSELDFTQELHMQVQDLAKRIEEKLVELENFPWQNRPSSSCSVKSDDVSVRGATNKSDANPVAQDYVTQISCGLRRLECSFDSLVRFEEVLLKKIRDGELKLSMENKRSEEINTENSKLRKDLATCRQQLLDFESFMRESKRQFSSMSASTPKAEALRHSESNFQKGLEASPIHVNKPRQGQQGEHEEVLIANHKTHGFDGSEGTQENELPDEYRNGEFSKGDDGHKKEQQVVVSSNPRKSSDSSSRKSATGSNVDDLVKKGDEEEHNKKLDADHDRIEIDDGNKKADTDRDRKGSDDRNRKGSDDRNRKGSDERNRGINDSQKGREEPTNFVSKHVSNPGVVIDTNLSLDSDDSSFSHNDTLSDSLNDTGYDETFSLEGSTRNSKNSESLISKPDESSAIEVPLDAEILTYDVTSTSDYVVDDKNGSLTYIGTKILPPEDTTSQIQAQQSRLEGTEAKVQLGTAETYVDQLNQALEGQTRKSEELANQLKEVLSAQAKSCSDPGQALQEIQNDLKKKDRCIDKLKHRLDCALKAFHLLQAENEELRAYVSELENKVEEYSEEECPERM